MGRFISPYQLEINMTSEKEIVCEECGNTMVSHKKGRYTIYNCAQCNANVDIETFVAEYYSEEE